MAESELPNVQLFAFLHHLAAFALVAALAVEFVSSGKFKSAMQRAGRACRFRSPNLW